MTGLAETPVQGAVRVLATIGLVLTGLGAAFLFLAIRVMSTDPYFGEPRDDIELLLFGAAGAFVGACIAFYGLVKRAPGAAFAGAAGQAAGAVLFHWIVESGESDDYLTDHRLVFALVILVDVAVAYSARQIQRRPNS